MNTPYGDAWEKYEASRWGQDAINHATLGLPANLRKYLVNRLKSAFAEGWNSHKDYRDNLDGPDMAGRASSE